MLKNFPSCELSNIWWIIILLFDKTISLLFQYGCELSLLYLTGLYVMTGTWFTREPWTTYSFIMCLSQFLLTDYLFECCVQLFWFYPLYIFSFVLSNMWYFFPLYLLFSHICFINSSSNLGYKVFIITISSSHTVPWLSF